MLPMHYMYEVTYVRVDVVCWRYRHRTIINNGSQLKGTRKKTGARKYRELKRHMDGLVSMDGPYAD